jgi:AraC family transcriptional regulator
MLDRNIQKLCNFILQHLDEELPNERLSRAAGVSKFHLQRQFSAQTGVSLNKYVQLMRLKRASYQLAFQPDARILEVALNAGFESPESFARVFKKTFGQTPSQFRKSPDWPLWHSKFPTTPSKGHEKMDVKVIDFPETKIAVLEHRGPVGRLMESVGKFIEWRKESGLSPVKSSATFGLAYCDPNTTPPAEFRFGISGSISKDVPKNRQGVKTGTIPAGRCAVVRHLGCHDGLGEAIYYLYRTWLPENQARTRDFPCFFHYRNLITDVAEKDLITDIHLPIV